MTLTFKKNGSETLFCYAVENENKLWLSCAKLKLSYVEVEVEVVLKVGEEVAVKTRVQLLVRWLSGWVVG